MDDFEHEAALLSSLRHPNIVNFLRVCISALNRKHLIQEYLPRGSLEKLIFDCRRGIQTVRIKGNATSATAQYFELF